MRYKWTFMNKDNVVIIYLNDIEYMNVNRDFDNFEANINLVINDIINSGANIDDQANVIKFYKPIHDHNLDEEIQD